METTTVLPPERSAVRTIVIFFGTIILLGLFAIIFINLRDIESSELVNQTAPKFTLPLFDQFEEEEINLADLRGKVVVVNFWASWCVECYREAALLEQAWRDYKDEGVIFLGVDYLDTDKEALEYMARYDITYPSGPDIGDKISQDYAITGVPETFFIDKDGNIAYVEIGPIEEDVLYHWLDKLLAQPPQEL